MPYPKPPGPASAARGFFTRPRMRASSHPAQQKSRPDYRLVGFVTRIGFKPMTPNLEGLCSIQLSYRAETFSRNSPTRGPPLRNGGKNKKKSPRPQTVLWSKLLIIFDPPSETRLNKGPIQ